MIIKASIMPLFPREHMRIQSLKKGDVIELSLRGRDGVFQVEVEVIASDVTTTRVRIEGSTRYQGEPSGFIGHVFVDASKNPAGIAEITYNSLVR